MQVTFYGTRGSIAKPGEPTARYGGNTSCLALRTAAGTQLVIDCGTGAHGLGQALLAEGVKRGHLLIGHAHWDHIQGMPFFAPLFVPGQEWDVYGPSGLGGSIRSTLAGQMESTYFPVGLEQLGATIHYHNLGETRFQIDDVTVTTRFLNHPALTLAYKIEADGGSVVYACDHEPHSREAASGTTALTGQDAQHAAFIAGADLLIHDTQYTAAEYPNKVNWGHSTYEYAMLVARTAGVGMLAFTHHDPLRTDEQIDALLESARETMLAAGSRCELFAASEGLTIPLASTDGPGAAAAPLAPAPPVTDVSDSMQRALFGISDPDLSALLFEAAATSGIDPLFVADTADARELVRGEHVALAVVEHDPGHRDAFAVAQMIAQTHGGSRVPVLAIADREVPGGEDAGISEWLIRPFSGVYASAKMQAWVMRGKSRWKKASVPDDESKRLLALYSLNLLDTAPEPRFDRITDLARKIFDVPVSLISLVDENRQWFKSCIGIDSAESPRETSFCAHVVYSRKPMVVSDTLDDDRFAENPLVTGTPRVRFYAGAPLILSDGDCIGSLCLIDTRPRDLDEGQISVLEGLRDLVVAEIERAG
jgi:ribonuclease BN (tRNA processing enzyme)/DNA-binding response OmpR family regulator